MTAGSMVHQFIAMAATVTLMALQSPPSGRPLGTASSEPAPAGIELFTCAEGVLTVTTRSITLRIERGEITYLRNNSNGEVFANSYGYGHSARDRIHAPSLLSRSERAGLAIRFIDPEAEVTCRQSDAEASVTYTPADSTAPVLELRVAADEDSGDVVLQAAGTERNPEFSPVSIDAPAVNFRTPAVILGSGAKYERDEPTAQDQTSNEAVGQNAPSVAVIEGVAGVVSLSSETASYALDWIRLDHDPERDRLALHTEGGSKRAGNPLIESAPLRISVHPTWLDAAKHWRRHFEERTGARPLWNNRSEWVRRIHAVFSAINNGYPPGSPKFAELAGVADPASVLYFLWNGDRIVLYGDGRLIDTVPRPRPDEQETFTRFGWPVILYHPYVLIYSDGGEAARLTRLTRNGWLPAGYSFRPIFAGNPEQWRDYWRDIETTYDDSLLAVHPGASRTINYLVRNIDSYVQQYGARGVYLDTLGADQSSLFPPDRRVVEESDFRNGEIRFLSRLALESPDLGVMSEYQSPGTLPFTFYSWEGPAIRRKFRMVSPYRLNHPLRTALTGSYSWTREDASAKPDDIESALMGALPEVSLRGDYRVDADRARWSQERARLFCEEELFNDLPVRWDPDALAYYRGRNNTWFVFKRINATYGYVQIHEDSTETIRLIR